MFNNYLRITLRKLWRNRFHSVIHVLGLTIGVTSCVLLFLFIKYELSFDKFYADSDSIYRFVYTSETSSGLEHEQVVPYPFGEAVKNDLPEIGAITLLHYERESLIVIGKDKFAQESIIFADTNFFKVFNYEVISGNPEKDLARPNTAFLTTSTALKLFGTDNPIGKRFSIANKDDYEVVGLLADPPPNVHIPFNMVVSYETFSEEYVGGIDIGWGTTIRGYCYVKLNTGQSVKDVTDKMVNFRDKYVPATDERTTNYGLQPIRDIHYNQIYANGNIGYTVDTSYLFSLAIIGFLILVVACINFINLASALAVKKSKEIGVRKTLGAQKSQIIFQFLGEAFVLTLVSVVLSLGLVERILPFFNSFLDKQISFNLWNDPILGLFIFGVIIVVTLLAGLYPSLTLARFNAIQVLKARLSTPDKSSLSVRRGLVVFQFLISQILIIGTIVVASQISYFRNMPLGFSTDALINLSMPEPTTENLEAFRARLQQIPEVGGLTYCLGAPTSPSSIGTSFSTPDNGGKESLSTRLKPVDIAYPSTYGIELAAGRWMTEAEQTRASSGPDSTRSYVFVVNEKLATTIGATTPEQALGKEIIIGLNSIQGEIIGVVKDFHSSSFRNEIEPMVVMNFPFFYYSAGMKISTREIPVTIQKIEKAWNEVYPNYIFEYAFLDDHIAKLYEEENKLFKLIQVFSGLSIFIGCIGLFGLISFIVVQRRKEIGVRKVLGASVPSIIFNLSKEFLYLEVIAFIIAAPIAWYSMNIWLEGFAYRIELNPGIFLSGLVISLAIALATIGFQAFKAAKANPVNALKDE
jgi:putative ABC transport system permease protein